MGLFEKLFLPIGAKPAGGRIKWRHPGIPDELGKEREDARDDAKDNGHCEVCTALSGDYFPSFNMPQYPQHPNCDCMLFSIPKPTMLQANAVCAIEKITKYIFGEKYAHNHKIRLFKALGFTIEDAEYLKSEFERQAKPKYLKGDYVLGKIDKFGQRITIEIKLKSRIKDDIILFTGWQVHPLGYITCNTPLGDK